MYEKQYEVFILFIIVIANNLLVFESIHSFLTTLNPNYFST